ncbi:triose-phosphate transporter family-domain-containing protein [Pilobolus umbonatus]|nr:triose-phosphate transporter family-domain-containing protein [Pilobolus umbonatus]
MKVIPCGVAAAVEICCSNAALVYITLSFYTMVKSSTPIWVLLFAFVFGFEKPRILLIAIIMVMVTGVILTVEGETKYDSVGFSLVLMASIVSGLRWSMTQLLLQHERMGMSNPIATLFYLSPVMFVTMFMLSLMVEHPFSQFQHSKHFDTVSHVMESFGLMSIGGLLAFAMTLAELYLIKNTNTVTLSVAGISKEIVVIFLSVVLYGDVLTPKTLLGLFVSIIGIIAYNYYKISKVDKVDNTEYQMIPLHTKNRNLED